MSHELTVSAAAVVAVVVEVHGDCLIVQYAAARHPDCWVGAPRVAVGVDEGSADGDGLLLARCQGEKVITVFVVVVGFGRP